MLAAALAMPMFAEKQSIEERGNADYSSWLPQEGEFSIGFSVDPFANFLGKMFSTGANPGNYTRNEAGTGYNIGGQGLGYNPNGARLTSPVVSIMGNYMVSDNLGVKFNVGLIVDYQRDIANVQDDAARFLDPFSTAMVQDVWKHGEYGGSFSAGIEYRLGKKRVQGVFGIGAMYVFQTSSNKYSYGNGLSQINQQPTSAYDTYAIYDPADPDCIVPPYYSAMRLTNDAMSGEHEAFWHRAGLYTSVGVEWFVAPKIALGMNVNLDLLYKWSSNVCRQYEGYNLLTGEVETYTDVEGLRNYSGVTFGTENIGANLYVNFFFGK